MTKMEPVADCAHMGIEQLQEQIDVRRELQRQMVGTLYPNILEEEIDRLYRMLDRQTHRMRIQPQTDNKA